MNFDIYTADERAAEGEEDVSEEQTIDFVTLGAFIIDDIEYPPPRPPVRDVLGGAGSFSALGARLFSPPPLSRHVAWIVDQGSDFPASVARVIDSWTTSCLFRSTPERPTTRGWNGYTDASCSRRAFRYMTPKKRLTAADLEEAVAVSRADGTGSKRQMLLHARAVHMICSPQRCRELVTDLLDRRRAAGLGRPLIIWEPVPDLCVPDELLNCTNVLPLVDVCSPNHAELASFMGSDGEDPATGRADPREVEANCEQLLASMPLQSYTLVVRAGELGCYVARNGGRRCAGDNEKKMKMKKRALLERHGQGGLRPDTDMDALFAGLLQDGNGVVAREEIEVDPGVEKWFPAYHGDDGAVVDPTGGGNTFLGGLAVALARGKSIDEACAWGSVAASFALEQVGVPTLGSDDDGNETWNGVRVDHRLREYTHRLP